MVYKRLDVEAVLCDLRNSTTRKAVAAFQQEAFDLGARVDVIQANTPLAYRLQPGPGYLVTETGTIPVSGVAQRPNPPEASNHDPVNRPAHYTKHPSGVECIQITEHMNFNLGNAVKYIWRADEKGSTIEDLQKARWYLDREIQRRQGGVQGNLV